MPNSGRDCHAGWALRSDVADGEVVCALSVSKEMPLTLVWLGEVGSLTGESRMISDVAGEIIVILFVGDDALDPFPGLFWAEWRKFDSKICK